MIAVRDNETILMDQYYSRIFRTCHEQLIWQHFLYTMQHCTNVRWFRHCVKIITRHRIVCPLKIFCRQMQAWHVSVRNEIMASKYSENHPHKISVFWKFKTQSFNSTTDTDLVQKNFYNGMKLQYLKFLAQQNMETRNTNNEKNWKITLQVFRTKE